MRFTDISLTWWDLFELNGSVRKVFEKFMFLCFCVCVFMMVQKATLLLAVLLTVIFGRDTVILAVLLAVILAVFLAVILAVFFGRIFWQYFWP